MQIETRPASIADPDLGWEATADPAVTLQTASDLASLEKITWQGVIQLPARLADSQYRLMVKEYEQFEKWPLPDNVAQPDPNTPLERVIYAEALLLP